MSAIQLPSPLQQVDWQIGRHSYPIFVKRDDLIHPIISGNKWRKLRLLLKKAREEGKTKLVSFGGPWSNHLLALAAAAQQNSFEAFAFIRGEQINPERAALYAHFGMQYEFVARDRYRDKTALFAEKFGNDKQAFFIDEGGQSPEAIAGCGDIMVESGTDWDHIWLAAGTGSTSRGIYQAKAASSILHTILAVQSAELQQRLYEEMPLQSNVYLPQDGPRFGRFSREQLKTGIDFFQQTGIVPDPIYGLKTLNTLANWLKQQHPTEIGRVLWIHTGGIAGWAGYPVEADAFGLSGNSFQLAHG